MTQEYVALWVPAESLSLWVEHGAKLLQLSDILLGQAASTHGSQSTPPHTTRENYVDLGESPDDLEMIVMTLEPPATTQELETFSSPKRSAEMLSSGETSNVVYLRSRDGTQPRPKDTSDPSTNGAA